MGALHPFGAVLCLGLAAFLWWQCRSPPKPPPPPRQVPESAVGSSTRHTYTFVFGVVCTESRHEWRANLRQLYAAHAGHVLPIYVVSAKREHDKRWHERERNVGGRTADDVLFAKAAHTATMLTGWYREAHCSHKTMGWWQAAMRWPSVWYGKTDDDAVIDLPPLLSLLRQMPPAPVYGGIVRYSSLNASTLDGDCFSPGANGAVRVRQKGKQAAKCAALEGPMPYVEGPLEILSADVAQYLSTRAWPDPRQRCHFEDLYVGRAIASHPKLTLVNLDTLIGRKDVWDPRNGHWVGADSLLAHWVRSKAAFNTVSRTFEARRGLLSASSLQLRCGRWAETFALLPSFGCCHEWSICEPLTPTLRKRGARRR